VNNYLIFFVLIWTALSYADEDENYLRGSQIILNLKNHKSVVFDGDSYVIMTKEFLADAEQSKTRLQKVEQELKFLKAKYNKDVKRHRQELAKAWKAAEKASTQVAEEQGEEDPAASARDQYIESRQEYEEVIPIPMATEVWRKNRFYGIIGFKNTGRLAIKGTTREDGGVTYSISKQPQVLFGLGITRDITSRINISVSYIFPDEALLGLGWTL
jgi:hypothetical protein